MIPALIGLGIAIAGTAMQMRAQQQQKSATNAAILEQIRQQQKLTEQAKPILQRQLATATSPQKSLDEGEAKARRDYQKVQSTNIGQAAPPVSATGSIMKDPFAQGQQTLGNAAAAGNSRWSQFQLDQAVNDLIARGDVSMLDARSRNIASDYPLQLGAAQATGAGLYGAGQLMQSIGGVAGMYEATKPSKTLTATITPGAGSRTDHHNLM